MNKTLQLFCLLTLLLVTSCVTYTPFYNEKVSDWQEIQPAESSEVIFSTFLIGDGKSIYSNGPLLSMMETHLSDAGKNSAVIFLGDNVGPLGLPDSTHKLWDVSHKNLDAQLELLDQFKGQIFFLPGNHDWANGQKEGLERIKNQRKYIENHLDRKHVFLPEKGRPGPVEVPLTDDIVLIIIDSQWWFHEYDKSYREIIDEADLFVQIEDAISRNKEKKIIIATHHPLYSVGNHGGRFPAYSNIFPLLEMKDWLYVPLPGFLYTGYRKFFGLKGDLSHPNYKLFQEALLETFEGHSDIIYAASHEHNLQFVETDNLHHIISGAAGLATYAAKSKKTDFALRATGFAKLNYHDNGDVWLEFWVSSASQEGELAFRKKLFNKPMYVEEEYQEYLSDIDYSDSTITTYPNGEKYQAGNFKKVFFGDNYREEWITPVEVPVFDFNSQKGGLRIVKKGGGGQTKSLRLENMDGKQWVLRSLEKDPSKVIPEIVKIELAVDLVQDQMSAYLPWAALSVPRLADAAEIYHTNPEIVYLTKDPRLGKYLDDVWEGLYLFEERPNGNRDDIESFGRSTNIIGTPDLFEEIADNNGNRVDQYHFLKSRMMDILISDWDRHEDQWRWAGFTEEDQTVYKVVPRDRDQCFFRNEGIFPWISSRKFALRMNQGIDYDVKDMGGMVLQGKWLDRRFLNELTLEDWLNTARKMQSQITDEIIEASVYDMPEQIATINGAPTIAKLKSRRDKMEDFARTHYSIISKKVDVVGSNKREHFEVERLNNDQTKVTVHAVSNKGNKKDKFYERTFNHSETKEIRLYGLKGKDEFDIEGKVDKGITVRIIGGTGEDEVTDKSKVRGLSKKTRVYDNKKKNDLKLGTEGRKLTSNNPLKNEYNYYAFNYPKFIPLIALGYNADEGAVLGAGFLLTTYGFQKYPNASNHRFGFRFSSSTQALEMIYDGTYTDFLLGLDLHLHLDLRDPKYTQNYFGMGNETAKTTDNREFNQVKIGQIAINPELSKKFSPAGRLSAGILYHSYNIENTENRFIVDIPLNGLDSTIFSKKEYAGVSAGFQLDHRDNKILPTRGMFWETKAKFFYGLDDTENKFSKITSELSFFFSFRKPHRTVFALRVGGAVNMGDYHFFQANSIGGHTNLRGYRATRYSGDASLYQNSEIRVRLFNFSTYVAKGEFGILGFNDIGRVWLDGENSTKWHHGYGGGIWISPFKITVLSAAYELSKDEDPGLFSLKFKYLF